MLSPAAAGASLAPTWHDVEVIQALVDLASQHLDARVAAAAAGQGGRSAAGASAGQVGADQLGGKPSGAPGVPCSADTGSAGGVMRWRSAGAGVPHAYGPLTSPGMPNQSGQSGLTCGGCPRAPQ